MPETFAASADAWNPMGAAIADFYNGNLLANIVVKSNVEPDRSMPAELFFRQYKQFNKLERLALKMCKGKILDVGAGAGAHSLYLQQKGFDVTAIDISLQAAEVMLSRGIKNAFSADVFSLPPEPKYDTIILMMNGLGVAGTDKNLPVLLSKLKDLLNPGGQIIADTCDIGYVRPESRALSSLSHLQNTYYGVVFYQLCYKGRCSNIYPWLYASRQLLENAAWEAGFNLNIISSLSEQYLVRLQA